MPNLYTVPAGQPIAELAAAYVLATVPRAELARAVLLVPTRRACVTMRQAFQTVLGGATSLLPRMFPLADIDSAMLTLLGPRALTLMESIPAAMPDWQQRYLLTAQIMVFEKKRLGAVTLDYALTLAEELMTLQDTCARAGVTLTPENLRSLIHADFATHWEQSLQFLGILADHWPDVERAHGLTIQARREVQVLQALADEWRTAPPDFPIFAIGSTASQEATARLLHTIADMPTGTVILSGIDPAMTDEEWQTIAPGHPLYHVKQFLDRLPIAPHEVPSLKENARSVWLMALSATDQIPHWHEQALPPYDHVKLIPCQHAEEEARVIALLLREALETPQARTALITPDESLMARVSAHMKRYGVTVDRLTAGTLATTETGSLWSAITAAIAEPERLLALRHLLHHPLIDADPELLRLMEPYWYGVSTHRPGQLPRLPEAIRAHHAMPRIERLVHNIARLSRLTLTAGNWLEQIQQLLAPLIPKSGEGHEAVGDMLDAMASTDMLGPMLVREFNALLAERLAQPWRNPGLATHPQLVMLTPVEARLQQFDRVILANMQDSIWPGLHAPNAWLNLAAQKALGLPVPEERTSLMAHDLLMLGSAGEVFLTYPRRDNGSPTTRSRFIERLVTLLAMHGVEEGAITAAHYPTWASALDAAEEFAPSLPVAPRPSSQERPRTLAVSALDTLFTDPFSIYARYVLRLKPLKEIDAEPEASDFGSLAHRALQALTEHWNAQARAANEEEITAIADTALRHFSDRPNIALFWRTRLLRALAWVNEIEAERRTNPRPVKSEVTIEAPLVVSDRESITLHGRIDRLEEGTIVDYKTGAAPTAKDILNGQALQLLAYAMLLEADGEPTQALEYWSLPRGNTEGSITHVARGDLEAGGIPAKLRAALADMLDEATPFLACPNPSSRGSRYANEFDGISRYDEWAG